ncbi:AAA family ATPase [Serratia marcescens]|uniref:AAA family ATPase n=1 Tax=Serratia marcescens TaxID=615 RepID=UPI003EDB61FB
MIFIEGLPCAGKSLLVNALAAQGTSVCFELGKVLSRADFPGNGLSVAEVEKINEWFIAKECERMRGKAHYFDRSYFTHLCYAYAYGRFMSLDIFPATVKKYAEKISDGGLPLPWGIVYVDIESKESIARQENKIATRVSRGLPAFWRNEQFLNDTCDAYQNLFSSCFDIPVLSIDARLSTQAKLNQLNEWMSGVVARHGAAIDCNAFIEKSLRNETR